jgi:periplasmic copper chaperone A
MRQIFVAAAMVIATVPALAHETSNAGVTVAHPWARATPGGATVGAAYLEIKTAAGVDDTLVSISSPIAGRVELHTHLMEGDIMKMRRVENLPLKSETSTVLQPRGDHVMLMDLKQPLKEGDLIKLVLTFAKAGPLEIEATVEPIGAMGPHGMDHQPGTVTDQDAHHHGAHKH